MNTFNVINFNLMCCNAGYLGDGEGHVPPGSLHRAHGLPHLRADHPGHHSGEVSLIFSLVLWPVTVSPSSYGSKCGNYNETE